jgi:hypothetical protein
VNLPLWDLTWSLRRSVGGAFTAGAGWTLGLSFLRLAAPGADAGLAPHPLFVLLAGLFVGAAGGLMERSASLTARGAAAASLAGAAAAAVAGGLFAGGGPAGAFWAQSVVWAVSGAAVALVSGRFKGWETAGALLAGGLGGALSWNFAAALSFELVSPGWPLARGAEFLTGAVLGAVLWGGMAVAQRVGLRGGKGFLA